jgi:hypothetical protein
MKIASSLSLCLVLPLVLPAGVSSAPMKPRPKSLAENARTVVGAIVEAARRNARLPARTKAGARPPFRRTGDDLMVYYVQEAARAARRLPADEARPAYLLALGVALDTTNLLRKNPVTAALWEKVETDKTRAQRLKVIGEATVHGRHDLALHFVVSAALTAVSGARAAEAAGILKEILDANGGSGFSFADLAADLSGIAFAEQVLASKDSLARIEKSFTVADHALSPKGLVEGLSAKDFAARYGSASDKRFRTALEALRKRVYALPAYKERKKEK